MSQPLYLLDTNVLLALIRGKELGRGIDRRFGLSSAPIRSLVCIVSHAELAVLARRNEWGEKKVAALQTMLDNLVTVDISHPKVIEAYVDIDLYSQSHAGGARNMGKNDLWIAAAARVSGAVLLTTDSDFEHLIPDLIQGEVIRASSPAKNIE